MADYTDLHPDILPHVQACPLPTITRAIQVIAQDFFQRSEAYTHTITATGVALNDYQVTVDVPANTKIAVPLDMYLDGELLATTNHKMLGLEFGDWKAATPATPTRVMVDETTTDGLIIALPSDGAYLLSGRIAVKPLRSATTLPDYLIENHGDAIVAGVLSRLFLMKNTEWYDPKLGAYNEGEYERAIDEAMDVSNKGNTSRPMTTTYGGL